MTYEEIRELLTSTDEVADMALATLQNARRTRISNVIAASGKRSTASQLERTRPGAEEWIANRVTSYLEAPAPFDFRHHLDSPTYADCWSVARAIEALRGTKK